jgi:hypothetical protein
MSEEITNNEDTIDSRDVIARISELRENRDGLDNSELFELDALITLDRQGKNAFHNWETGVTLVANSHFEAFAEELANDLGIIDANASWPIRHIDWKAAAHELKTDYRCLDFDGVEYWVR